MRSVFFGLLFIASLSSFAVDKGMYLCRGVDKDVNIYFNLRFENKTNIVKDAFVQVNREGGSYDGRSVRIYEERISSLKWSIDAGQMRIDLNDIPVDYKKFRLISFVGNEALLYDYSDNSEDVYGYRGQLKYIYKSFWWGDSEGELEFQCYFSERIIKPSINN